MAFIDPKFPGVAYGMGVITEDGNAGQFVKLSGQNQFSLNGDPAVRSFGVLYKDAKAGELCTAFTCGGIYETDNFTGTVNPGDSLKVDATNKNLVGGGLNPSDVAVAQAVSVQSGILRFKLLI